MIFYCGEGYERNSEALVMLLKRSSMSESFSFDNLHGSNRRKLKLIIKKVGPLSRLISIIYRFGADTFPTAIRSPHCVTLLSSFR